MKFKPTRLKTARRSFLRTRIFKSKPVLFVLGFVLIGGVAALVITHAATVTSGQYVWNSSGISHSAGSEGHNLHIYFDSAGARNYWVRDVWDNYYPNGHYMWHGPKTQIANPYDQPLMDIRFCFQFATDQDGKTVKFDAVYYDSRVSRQRNLIGPISYTLQAGSKAVKNGVVYYKLQTKCWNHVIDAQSDPPDQVFKNVEMRVLTQNYGHIWVYKTSWELVPDQGGPF